MKNFYLVIVAMIFIITQSSCDDCETCTTTSTTTVDGVVTSTTRNSPFQACGEDVGLYESNSSSTTEQGGRITVWRIRTVCE